MKTKIKKLLAMKSEQRDNLNARLIESDDKEERAEIGKTLKELGKEIADLEAMLAELEKKESEPADGGDGNPADGGDGEPAADGDGEPEGARSARRYNHLATLSVRGAQNEPEDMYSTVSYRKAFQKYLSNGNLAEFRATTKTTDSNVGTVIPTNLVNQIIEKWEQLGVVYNLVTKTSFPVGQTIPVDGVKPTATWVSEGAGSTPQGKTLSASIVFTHFKLRCEVRYTEEIAVMALPAFEALFVKQVSEAMLRAIEAAIISGNGSTQPKGILTETAPKGQAITIAAGANNKLTYQILCDAEAAVPVDYESTAKWAMTKKTFMKFVGMTDSAGQPIARVNYGINGVPERVLLGREVVILAPPAGSKLGNYEDAASSDIIFAFIVDFGDYVLNENYNLSIMQERDWDTEDHKIKSVAACDGKLIKTDSLVTLTKTKTGG